MIDIERFYKSPEWERLRIDILISDKYECQICKQRGYYTKANTVHHVNYIKLHPELALEKYYTDDEGNVKRNLISLCHNCHEEMHGHRQREKQKPLTQERW